MEESESAPGSSDSRYPALSTMPWLRRRDQPLIHYKGVNLRLDHFALLSIPLMGKMLPEKGSAMIMSLALPSVFSSPATNHISNLGQLLCKCRLLAIITSTCHSAWHLVGTQQMFVEPNRIT